MECCRIRTGHSTLQNGTVAVAVPDAGLEGRRRPLHPRSRSPQRLVEGNQRFVAGTLKHPNQSAARRDELATGHTRCDPRVQRFACVPVELIFDQVSATCS
jgi:hypothetical protein